MADKTIATCRPAGAGDRVRVVIDTRNGGWTVQQFVPLTKGWTNVGAAPTLRRAQRLAQRVARADVPNRPLAKAKTARAASDSPYRDG